MPGAAPKDLLTRLADAGEAAIKSIGEAPGAERFVGAATALRDRLDELQRRVRGLEALEERLAALERRVDRLSRSGSTAGSRSRKTAARRSEASRSRAGKDAS